MAPSLGAPGDSSVLQAQQSSVSGAGGPPGSGVDLLVVLGRCWMSILNLLSGL